MRFHVLHKTKLLLRKIYLKPIIRKLNKFNFSIVSNTCVGGYMLHDYCQRFNSPFINTYIPIRSYIFLINDFQENMKKTPVFNEILTKNNNCPVGTIYDNKGNDINFYFAHANSFEDALNDWKRRADRINYNNLIFLFDERSNEFDKDYIAQINNVRFKHYVFSTRKLKGINNFIRVNENDYAWEFNNKFSFKKPFDKIKLHKIIK